MCTWTSNYDSSRGITHTSYLNPFDPAEEIIKPLWIVAVDDDVFWAGHCEVPANNKPQQVPPAHNSEVNTSNNGSAALSVGVLLVLRICVGQMDFPWIVHWNRCQDALLKGHRQDSISTVVDVFSW